MKVILRADIAGLGKRGDIVEVATGHGRNFLLPKQLAMVASDGAVAQAGAMRRRRDLRDAKDREAGQTIAQALVARTITIRAKAGAEGKLYGSVTAGDIVDAVAEQADITLERRQIVAHDPIRTVGTHTVNAKLHSDVEFPITLEVVAR